MLSSCNNGGRLTCHDIILPVKTTLHSLLSFLLAGVYWTHKAVILRITHTFFIGVVVIASLFGALKIYKCCKKLKAWFSPRSPNLADIDSMTGLDFEKYVAQLLRQRGYQQVRLTEKYD